MKLVFDFGRILDHISKPACSNNAGTMYEALTMFEHYYEANECFDHYTHGIGPGIVGLVIHLFMEFMGELVNQPLDHNITGPKRGTPLSVYVNKLHDIVSTVVTEEAEESSGRLSKKVEEVVAAKSKSRGSRTKQTERKHQDDILEVEDVDDDIVSVSGSEDENQFTTLLGPDGSQYHPPSRKRQQSRYAHKQQTDINKKLDSLRDVMQDQQNKINRLQKENESAKLKLKRLRDSKSSETKQSKSKPLVPARPVNKSDSDSDVQELNKPDSTQTKVVATDSGSEDITSGQSTQKKKKKRARIDSSSTGDQMPEKGDLEAEEDPAVVSELRQKKADLEEKCSEMERKLMEQRMDNKFREFQDDIRDEINKFRCALMAAYGKNLAVESTVVDARERLRKMCETVQYMGYTRRVGTEFLERLERSLLCGQVPERQMKYVKINNSQDDPILGHVVDVVYEISMPVIVKSEQIDDEDEDLVLLGVTPGIPAASVPFDIQVKQEKTAEDDADSQSQLPSPVFGNKAPPTQKSPAKEMDSEDESQGSKRTAATPEKTKPGHIKKKKKSPGAVVTQRELRPRTTRK